MGSFKSNGRNQGPDRRRGAKGQRRRGFPRVESLEGRLLLDGGAANWKPTTTDINDVRNGPMADVGQDLIKVYLSTQNNNPVALKDQFPLLMVQGNSVGVDVKGSGDYNTFLASLRNLGMTITASSPAYMVAEGMIPASELYTLARMTQTIAAAPVYRPMTGAGPSPAPLVPYQGAADNEGLQALNADTARQQTGLDGTGVTVGVLSDSANKFQGGLADSQKTGDLPANVQIIQDGPDGSTDEGRAMMENIHDIAPGAKLAFASAFVGGQLQFANNIRALSQAGASVIVDDVIYMDEPMFQPGFVSQGVNDVVNNNNVTYVSMAWNATPDTGYLSTFRGVDATVGSIGAGRFMNFAPSGAPVTQLPITVKDPNTVLTMQFDQPYGMQEPAGSTNHVTSEVDFYVLDSSGKIVASSTNNNVATDQPVQTLTIPNAGSYTVAIKVTSGTDPGHVQFVRWGQSTSVQVSQQFGSAGGTYYPSSWGHNATSNAIGVGAVPWWAPSPFANASPLNSEPFSSEGPSLTVRDRTGALLAAPVVNQNPAVSGTDGGNTTFFEGPPIDTSNPPLAGQPKTATNLSQNLPSFFGTSSASPNVAAVVALMKQRNPNLTSAQVRAGLIASAQPLNGATPGTWDPQGGYGLVDAVRALAAVDVLRVATVNPTSGTTLTTAPTQIVVTFNRPVDFRTITPADLAFLTVPSSLTNMSIGKPIAIDDPNFPTQVAFPFTFTLRANQLGNGTFTYAVRNPAGGLAVLSKDGKPLEEFRGSFNVADTVDPRVANVTVNGRVVTVQFTEAMNPATITPSTIFLSRLDPRTGAIVDILNNDPNFKMSYNPATFTATLDYSGLSQSRLVTGNYKLTVRAGNPSPTGGFEVGATDVVGNKLDGEFFGTFPSGDGDIPTPANPTGRNPDENFNEVFRNQVLQAPVITSLTLLPQYDTGIKGDENTSSRAPAFIGQVSNPFPGTVANLTVYAEFWGLHAGSLTLNTQNGRGFTGVYDVKATTDANGTFVLQAPFLPEGFERVRLVVVGQAESQVLAGLSTSFDHAFRIDTTAPNVVSASLTPGGANLPLGGASTNLNGLTSLSLNVVDPASPINGPLSTPTSVFFPALDPATASNISNYTLINLDDAADPDKSRFIATAKFTATASDFVSGPSRQSSATPYYGRVDLTFSPGLNKGHYILVAHTAETIRGTAYNGLTDAAGNPLDDSGVAGEGTTGPYYSAKDFVVQFAINPVPVYVVTVTTGERSDPGGDPTLAALSVTNAQGNYLLPRSYYEISPPANDPNVSAPPHAFFIDFSSPLDPTKDYTDAVQLVRSADGDTAKPDGDFGTLGVAGLGTTGTGFTRVNPPGTRVILTADALGNPNSRLVLLLPVNYTLPADHYRLYMPNSGAGSISDIYGNQLDGEFLGDPATSGIDPNGNPVYEDLLPTGQYRQGMSGDLVPGGAFMTGFTVVPTGNVIYARPDYVEDPLLPSTTPDGSLAKPYPVLAPQAAPNALNQGTLNNGDPNGGLNSSVNFGLNFDPRYDRAGLGKFARSAFYAASQLSTRGPVVVVALPGTPQRNPVSGVVTQKTFVLQAPAGSNPQVNDGSASVPFDTTLVFNPGSTLKLLNASLFVQNQGSALQAIGGNNPNDRVTFTSYKDDSVAGDTNGDRSDTSPTGGDWGGLVFRNFNAALTGRTQTFPVDGTLIGFNGSPAVSGADDSLSTIQFANIKYAGGAVPYTRGTRYDAVMLFNSRPAIVQDNISFTSGAANGSAQAAISGDLDSFREDDTARGPLIRRVVVAQNGINGIWVRPQLTGYVQASDAEVYPDNPLSLGGVQNYTFDAPLPYVLLSRMEVGTQQVTDTATAVNQPPRSVLDRLYVQPGVMVKFQRGAGIEVKTPGSSINVGDRTYISGFDANASIDPTTGLPTSTYGPNSPDFRPSTTGDARVVFTSLYDNTATTSYFDPLTQQTTTIVPAIDSPNTGPTNPYQPVPGNVPALARWGSISVYSGAIGDIDEAEIRYGGGSLNVAGGTTTRQALSLFGSRSQTTFRFDPVTGTFVTTTTPGMGSRVMVTNNNFFDDADAPIYADPDALLATDPTRPLASGHPFFRGNVLLRNDFNALAVGQIGGLPANGSNLSNNSSWDQTDITYLLRGTIIPQGDRFGAFGNPVPLPGATPPPMGPELSPSQTLTIQSALPGTVLADGSSIPRPGQSVVVKLLGAGPGDGLNGSTNADNGGAGFLFGVDDGIDPPADPLIDQGNRSALRILGIGGNETTGQQRVPVVITSVHDNKVGPTVRGFDQTMVIPNDTTAPKPGDGGLIYFGGNSMTTYNAFDIREGNKIDNADIRYITRIEMQGGGNINYLDLDGQAGFTAGDSPDFEKRGAFPNLPNGQPDPRNGYIQGNANKELTISNSNFTSFRDAGVLEHHGFNIIAGGARAAIAGEPNLLFMYNNTISNMPIGVRIVGEQVDNTLFPDPNELLLLNNTFYNNDVAADVQSVAPSGTNQRSHVHFIAMDNIFSNSKTVAVRDTGQINGSELEYNLFFSNAQDFQGALAGLNFQPIFGDPKFRDPANGNFQLMPGSAAIDAARSEMALNPDEEGAIVGTLIPIADQVLDATGGIRNSNSREPDSNNFDLSNIPTNLLTLPGYPNRGYVDQWIPVLPSDPTGVAGPDSSPSTFNYAPMDGERDQLGYLRVKDPNSSNIGYGSRPFFDIGAYEYRNLTSPKVTGVTATVVDPSNPSAAPVTVPLYRVGGYAGTNKQIQSIQVQFDNRIDPATITDQTVTLQASGGDGIFGNNNSANDKFYNLAGKLSFDPISHVLTINVGAAGLNLLNDEYRLTLLGSGSTVLRDPQGNALDGENTVNGDPNGAQLALPSGDGFPGGNFFDTFVINTQAPTISPGTFQLDPGSDTNVVGDSITDNNKPSFSGTIKVALPQISPLAGQTVILDLSTKGDGNFDVLNAGTALTNANGQFLVTVGTDGANTGLVKATRANDSPYVVGADGILHGGPAFQFVSGVTQARIRVIDQSGNVSNFPTDPVSSYAANGALTRLIVDTAAPVITAFSPAPNTPLTPTGGKLTFSFTTNENLDPASVNASTLLVTRAGPDGVLGTKDDVSVPVNPTSIQVTYLGGAAGPKGPERVTFSVTGALPNDLYRVTLKGTGTPITDVAGNPLGGNSADYTADYIVTSGAAANILFVGGSFYSTDPAAAAGTRNNPYPTITAALAKAGIGDIIAVLPGVYTENVALKAFVTLKSVDASSTQSNLVNGDPLKTVIRAPSLGGAGTGGNVTVSASYLTSITGVNTQVTGFTIASPLLGDPALGTIDPTAVAAEVVNSDVLFDHDYFVDSHIGVHVVTTGALAPTPRILNSGIIGNDVGIMLDDKGAAAMPKMTQVVNNTIALNTIGVSAISPSNGLFVGNLTNNIFWQNHSPTPARGGTGIYATSPGKLIVNHNLFSGNGASDSNPGDDAVGVGGAFNPFLLQATPDGMGNYTGNPAFVSPRDPRPGQDGPAAFFVDASFDLTAFSAAIDTADNSQAPPVDFLYRGRVKVTGRGFPGTGPADVGAFEYQGKGGSAAGGAFRVATSSLSVTGAPLGNGSAIYSASAPPSKITLTFSGNVNPSTLQPSSVVLYGDGLSTVGPARVTGVSWLNGHTAVLTLSKGFSNQGSVVVSIPAGAVKSAQGNSVAAFRDFFRITPGFTGVTAMSVGQGGTPTAPAPAPTSTVKAMSVTAAPARVTAPLPLPSLSPAPLVASANPITPPLAAFSVPQGPIGRLRRLFNRAALRR